MKRFILTIMCIFTATSVFAQLNITSQNEKIEKIGVLRSTYAYVYNQGTDYYLNIRSSNQFDDNCLFCLGETAESAILTTRDLIDICEKLEVNASVNAQDAKGQSAMFVKKKMMGNPYLDIIMLGQAGTSNITKPELERVIEIIEKHNSKKQ